MTTPRKLLLLLLLFTIYPALPAHAQTNEDGNYGFYAIGEQMVYRERVTSDQGLTSWAALTYAPQQEINTFPLFVSGGLVYLNTGTATKRLLQLLTAGLARISKVRI